MARVTVSLDQVKTARDLSRFLELLDLIGIDPQSTHPIHISVSGAISAALDSESLALPDDDTDIEESE